MKYQKLIYLLLISFLSGCAVLGVGSYPVTYNTEPVGASVICNGTNRGYSPVTVWYPQDEDTKEVDAASCTAIWSSGLRKDFDSALDLNKYPNGVGKTLQRPNTEGYSQDAEFALKLRQTEAAESAAAAAHNSVREEQQQNAQQIEGNIRLFKFLRDVSK